MDCSFRTGVSPGYALAALRAVWRRRGSATTGSFNAWLAGCGLLTGWHLAPTNTRIKPIWEIGVGGVQVPARRERAAIGRQSVPR